MAAHHPIISAPGVPVASPDGRQLVTHYSHQEGSACIAESNLGDRPVSTYLRGSRATIASVHRHLPAKSWLVLPCYFKRDGRFSDWQSQISGKTKMGESLLRAAQRELAEEIGLIFPTTAFIPIASNHSETHYIADVGSAVVDPSIRSECSERAARPDDGRGRVVVYLYVKDDQLTALLPRIQARSRVHSDDSAGRLIFVVPAATVASRIE